MPHLQFDWQSRIKSVERDWTVADIALARLLADAEANPTVLDPPLSVRDVPHAARNLEGTYFIRLFAEFETGLRHFWHTIRPNTSPRCEDLVNGVGARRRVPSDLIEGVHEVREYRNQLVHERDDAATPVTLTQARQQLCKYFARLPAQW